MVVYLLRDRQTDTILGVYKYKEVALVEANRDGLRDVVTNMFNGKKSENRYSVEVWEVIE